MSNPPYRALRIILGIVSVFTAVAGLLIVFSGRSLVMRLLLRPPETEVSTLLLFLMRELGGLALMLSVLFFFASRDPVRNVAIVKWAHCGPLHPGHNTLAVALHAGHSPTLSWLPDLGSVANPLGNGRRALFPATARGPWRTILEDNEGMSSCLARSLEIPILSG